MSIKRQTFQLPEACSCFNCPYGGKCHKPVDTEVKNNFLRFGRGNSAAMPDDIFARSSAVLDIDYEERNCFVAKQMNNKIVFCWIPTGTIAELKISTKVPSYLILV